MLYERIFTNARILSPASVIHNNTLHVFDAKVVLDTLRTNSTRMSSISSIKIYIGYFKYYGFCQNSLVYDTMDDDIYFANIIKLIEFIAEKKLIRKRIILIRHSKAEKQKEIANNISKYCDTNHILHRVIGAHQFIYYPKNPCVFVKSNEYEKLSVYLEPDGYISVVRYRTTNIILTDRGLPLIMQSRYDMVEKNRKLLLTVEDYGKWYTLYLVDKHYTLTDIWKCSHVTTLDPHNIQWFDDSPVPESVVNECAAHNIEIDFISYIAICYRFAEDYLGCDDPTDIPSDYLPDKITLQKVLNYNHRSYSEYFQLPWTDFNIEHFHR